MSIDSQNEWLDSSLGQYLIEQEQIIVDNLVSDIFGFKAIQLGMLDVDFLQSSRMPYKLKVGLGGGGLVAEPTQLPLTNSAIDLVILPHLLEFSDDPHQALREAERVLVPEGHLVVTGFNPISAWGARRLLSKKLSYPWSGNFISLLRIKDWLALLGLELVELQMGCHVPPFSNPTWLNKFRFMDNCVNRHLPMMGGVYVIVAKKRVVGMRLIKPNWAKRGLKTGFVSVTSQKTDRTLKCQKQK